MSYLDRLLASPFAHLSDADLNERREREEAETPNLLLPSDNDEYLALLVEQHHETRVATLSHNDTPRTGYTELAANPPAPTVATLSQTEAYVARRMGLDPEKVQASKAAADKRRADAKVDAEYERTHGYYPFSKSGPATQKSPLPNQPVIPTTPGTAATPTGSAAGHGIGPKIPTPRGLTSAEREVALAMGLDPAHVAESKTRHLAGNAPATVAGGGADGVRASGPRFT